MSEWQPISSAPIGWEHEVDLWVENCGHGGRISDCRASLSNGKPDWHTRSDDGWQRIHGKVTHWMPLPVPPEQSK